MKFPITWVEVFAEKPLTGSLLPVIHNVDNVPTEQLANIARRFLQPETSFIQPSTDSVADYRHRIFTVNGEIPFAGHPSLGCAAAMAFRNGESEAAYTQQTISGTQALNIQLQGAEGVASIIQNDAEFGAIVSCDSVRNALGLRSNTKHGVLKPQIVSTGLPALILPVNSVATLSDAKLDRCKMRAALQPIGDAQTLNVYVVAKLSSNHWRARSFALDLSNDEDPATGSAAGPFGAYVKHYLGDDNIYIDQGVEMNMPSRLYVDTSTNVCVSGKVRVVSEGTYDIPV